jgi:hypothetical protein
MTDADRAAIAEKLDESRDRAVFFTVTLFAERFCDQINSLREQTRRSYDPVLYARIGLLDDAIKALTLRDVGAVLELLTTEREWLVMVNDPKNPTPASGSLTPLGPDLRSANQIMSCIGAELFMRGDAYFMTTRRRLEAVTEEVLVVRLLPFGAWDLDPQTKAEEAAEREVELAERILADVQARCEAEPGDRVSRSLAEDRRSCAVRVFDAHMKRRLVELKRLDLASAYERGEIQIHPYDERTPIEIAEALSAEALAA